jgi:uncharacterized protein (DUF427 family)
MPKAEWNGQVIAEAGEDDIELLEGNVYFPRSAVREEFLQESDKTTRCPWKGTAHYYDVVVDGRQNRNAAWYYPQTTPEARQIADRIAFWGGVRIDD